MNRRTQRQRADLDPRQNPQQFVETCHLMRSFCFLESRLGHLSHYHHPGKGECCGLQQAVHGLFSGDLNQEARGENQYLLPFCSI